MRSNSIWSPSAPSRTNWAPSAWRAPLVLATAVGLLALIAVSGIAYALIARERGASTTSAIDLLPAQLFIYVPWTIYLLAILPRLSHVSLRELGFRKPTAGDVVTGLAGAALMWIVITGAGTVIVALSHHQADEAAIAVLHDLKTPLQKALFAAIGIVVGPIVEELTFRVFLFNAFSRYATVAAAALGSGLLFGLAHAQGKPGIELETQILTISIPLALGGVVLAYVYARTRCFWSNVTSHGLFNAVSIVAVLVFHAK